MSNSGNRNISLDGLRGFAILSVIIYHIGNNFSPSNRAEYIVEAMMNMGWSGVDLFFVLSGFLITRILLQSKQSDHYFRNFYARRILRIFPLYFSVLAFFFLFVPSVSWFSAENYFWLHDADRSASWFWLYLSNIHIAITDRFHHAALGVTWSLAIEEQYYLLWPLIVWLVPRDKLLMVCLGILLLSPGLRTLLLSYGASNTYVFAMTFCRLDGLAAGALVAMLMMSDDGRESLKRWVNPTLLLSLLGTAVLIFLIKGRPGLLQGENQLPLLLHSYMQMIGLSLLVILFASILVKILNTDESSFWNRAFRFKGLRILGKYSYSMYLSHSMVIILLGKYVFDFRVYQDWPLLAVSGFILMTLTTTLLLAKVTWVLIEAPCQSLKCYFPSSTAIQKK